MARRDFEPNHIDDHGCARVRLALEHHFDQGEAPNAAVLEHVAHCVKCAAHQAELEALDGFLRAPTAIPADPALEARIRAGLQAQTPRAVPPWLLPVSAAAVIMLLAALGHGLHGLLPTPPVTWSLPTPLLPEWAYLRQELIEIPTLAYHEVAWVKEGVGGMWNSIATWTGNVTWGRSGLLWTAFAGCVIAALGLDALEWTNRHRRSGH